MFGLIAPDKMGEQNNNMQQSGLDDSYFENVLDNEHCPYIDGISPLTESEVCYDLHCMGINFANDTCFQGSFLHHMSYDTFLLGLGGMMT